MKEKRTPVLDARDAAAVLQELLARRPAYVPELRPVPARPAYALLQIFSRYMQVIIERLNQAPDKNLLAFLDMMGISLIPAKPARAAVVFLPAANARDGRIEAGTRLGATVPGAPAPMVFETESAIALAAAKLVEVVSLWPARDQFSDHSMDLAGGRRFTLFEPAQPVQHELYLAHKTLLPFAGMATIDVEFELSTAGSAPLSIVWEAWDGQAWRQFVVQDGTTGLTRSGVVKLSAECGDSVKTTINGISSFWIRGSLDQPLPPDPARVFAMADRVRLRTGIDRPLQRQKDQPYSGAIKPDQAFANGSQIDLSATFFPFGKSPDDTSVFYLSSEEVFSKPGAVVNVGFTRVKTPEQEADEEANKHEAEVHAIKDLINSAAKTAKQVVTDAATIPGILQQINARLGDAVAQATGIHDGIAHDVDLSGFPPVPINVGAFPGIIGDLDKTQKPNLTNLSNFLKNVQQNVDVTTSGIVATTITDANKTLAAINDLNPEQLVSSSKPPAAKLLWEYWNGSDWKILVSRDASLAANFQAAPTSDFGTADFSFKVPDDLIPAEVNRVSARWIRARIVEGSYNHLRLVSWVDSVSKIINFMPILESRPPALQALFLGYSYRSQWEGAEECLTKNDFQFEYHSLDVRAPGSFFPPFKPVADALPALYLGFDRPLPNDLVTLYFDLPEADAPTPPLVWEAWDGTTWQALSVTDGTAGLARPGVVSFISPDVAPRPTASVGQASGTSILTNSSAEAAVFWAGNQVVIQQENAVELATVRDISDAVILLQTPLSGTYSGGAVSLASLPRFGSSRDWVRARLKQDGAPARSWINGVFPNTAWAAQVRTVVGEVLGSGTAQPNQTVFLSQAPVLPDEQIEVRELQGARAHVEFSILQDEFRKRGYAENLIRTVSDPRSGHITEVWVRWQAKPHLFFSGPDDRHYVIERARGRIIFGDGKNGRIPAAGVNNIRAARYQSTDGLAGNVPAGKITQLLGITPLVQSITNPRAADGGADGEKLDDVFLRGPQVMRHQGRSLAARDYEALAREASPGVAAVKALPATAPNLRPAAGWVTLIVVPQSADAQPQPTQEFRREVHDFLTARAPATVCASHVSVIGPTYLPLGVRAFVSPIRADDAGAVKARLLSALTTFLQPVTGGPEGRGWAFGRDVFLSDVARLLEAVEGVDYVRNLELLVGSVGAGERVPVPANRIVAAGPLHIEIEIAGGLSCHCR